jgi:DNA-directed RNA polymerase specialized sigma subunit
MIIFVLLLFIIISYYNKNKNTCFQAFAFFRINGAIRDYLRELSWGSRRRPIKMQDIKI